MRRIVASKIDREIFSGCGIREDDEELIFRAENRNNQRLSCDVNDIDVVLWSFLLSLTVGPRCFSS